MVREYTLPLGQKLNPQRNPHTMDDQKLFNHMADEHGLLLLQSQMREIIDIVLEMHNEKPEKCTESIERQYKEKGNQLDQVYGAMKEEIEIATELETSINGWQRVKIDFTVEVKPRWWQFWKPRIDAQDFQWSAWLKPKGEAFLYQPQIEKK